MKRSGYSSLRLGMACKTHLCTAPYLYDIVSVGDIPIPIYFPCFLIINTSTVSSIPGHWLLLFFPSRNSIEYFNSLCNPPSYYSTNLDTYIKSYSFPKYIRNKHRYQSYNSYNCGLFCLFIADKRCMGYTYSHIMNYFNKTLLLKNDRIVERYYKHHIQNKTLKRSL